MKIKSIEIRRYRSITSSDSIDLSNLTVLIGPNNEGKSNILNALVCAMGLIRGYSEERTRYVYARERIYDWYRDYPIQFQGKARHQDQGTYFRLTFELTAAEIEEFRNEVKSNLNGTLPIEITVGKNPPEFKVVKGGRGAATLAKKSRKIAAFIGSRVRINYIPAVRTDQDAMSVISGMVSASFHALERNDEYRQALDKIAELQQPILTELSEKITRTLRSFLPQVSAVTVNLSNRERSRALRSAQILVNDGNLTPIEQKGDGVKSLAAISLLHEVNEGEELSLLALEEPEAHLHPEAIHRLREVIEQIATRRQVVITTHCPLLANRNVVANNIIVKDSTAKPAKKISDVRKCLGVRVSDNLQSAHFVILTEGEDDKIIFDALLPVLVPEIGVALRNGVLLVDYVGGAGNFAYKASHLKSSLHLLHVVADNDRAGTDAVNKMLDQSVIAEFEYTLTNCAGMPFSELEDCFSRDAYKGVILDTFGVSLDVAEFRGNTKWSDRIKICFQTQGKQWSDRTEASVKSHVANHIAGLPDPSLSLCPHKGAIVRRIADVISRRLRGIDANSPGGMSS